ncbi:MAG TPA: hypothetical protein VGT02_06545 [Methylomirabilota bacterium]|jgi:hypothetical protein|nr:hypothetical protein [Methylomirabilota bacterium]
MTPGAALDRLIRRVHAQVRRRRVEHYALRGFFWGSLPAVLLLALKGPLGARALPAAAVLLVGGALTGAVWGAFKRTSRADAARLADRAFGLEDRVATAMEWAERPDRTPLVDSLVADATARVEKLAPRQIVGRILPREAHFLPVPLVVALALTLAPALPLPVPHLPDFSTGSQEEEKESRTGSGLLEERSKPTARDRLRPPAFEEREFQARSGSPSAGTAGDLSAVFKDTALSSQRPDFNSFLKKGDERLKLLEQVDRLPDLASDFTTSQYKMVFRKSKALTSGLRPDQISPQKLRELLEEMERLGRKGGNWTGEVGEGMEALEGGQTDKAMEAMQKALDKMRAQDEASRSGKNLRGGRDQDRGGSSRDRRGGEGGGEGEDFGEGEGLLPGKGRSTSPKGEATRRLSASPYDVGVEGESRRGRKDGYDTNMTGRGGPMASRLHYLGVIGQYRKLMEDAITREAIPRDYHSQIKDYFQALDER